MQRPFCSVLFGEKQFPKCTRYLNQNSKIALIFRSSIFDLLMYDSGAACKLHGNNIGIAYFAEEQTPVVAVVSHRIDKGIAYVTPRSPRSQRH